jgi:acetyl-CoA acyltransferase
MTPEIYIAGVGMTPFAKHVNRTVRSLAEEAAATALTDAGAQPDEVDMVIFANAVGGVLQGQEMIRGQVALEGSGLLGLPLVNVENACASSSSAVHLAWLAIASGQYETVLVVGAEQLTHPDKWRTFAAIGAAADVTKIDELAEQLSGGIPGGGAGSFFMDYYGDMGRRYLERTGRTARDFADVVVKDHRHGALNPYAQYRDLVTAEEVLESRPISGPLTLLMCSPIGDGAAAVLLCSSAAGSRFQAEPVQVRASVLTSGGGTDGLSPAERAARRAYAQAGVRPGDVDVVELHDAAAPAELVLYEKLGLCEPGQAGALVESGETTLGGRIPVNTSGGLLTKGHPLAATGAAQLVELTEQLRGHAGERQVDGARIALAENSGGHIAGGSAAAVVTILSQT